MELSANDMELYIKLAGWKFEEGRWVSPENEAYALTVDYAYMRQRWNDGFKDVIVNSHVRQGETVWHILE